MERYFGISLFATVAFAFRSLATATSSLPPIAKKVQSKIYIGKNLLKPDEYRGDNVMQPPIVHLDDYNWLRDETRKLPEVLDHLKRENQYTADKTKHLETLRNDLYSEILSHLKETDDDLPYPHDDYEYYSKTLKGLSYKIHCRRLKGSSIEEVILDENKLAEGHEYSVVSGHDPSPNHKLLAYGVDNSGYETYNLRILDMTTGQHLDDVIEDISGEIVWNSDSNSIFYMKMDNEHRPFDLYLHILGTKQSEDVSLFKENDQRFWLDIDKTQNGKYLIVASESKETSEQYIMELKNIDTKETALNLICLEPRKEGIRYYVESHEDNLFIITNKDNAKNNKIVKVAIKDVSNGAKAWIDVKPYDPSINIEGILPFEKWMVAFGREDGLERVWFSKDLPHFSKWEELKFEESLWSVWADKNMQYKATSLRIGYSSLVTPKRIMEFDVTKNSCTVLKQTEVPNYDPSQYECHRIYATARDGTKIPISIVSQKKLNIMGSGEKKSYPLILYGYGSYGASIDPGFDFKRIPLLDRGIIYAIAHIRGGGEMGRSLWYEQQGKFLSKMNTFTDFADCAIELAKRGITDSDKTAIIGRSAGGLLIGACVNMFPTLFKAAVADVPFLDVVNTMSDPTIPLTIAEWCEWGNPNSKKFYDYMMSYSPYDNIKRQDYPSLLITAGLNDPRVAYWEPAKFVAKLREYKTNDNELLFKTDLSSGHFSASDRYKYLTEAAFEYSWILNQICK